MTPDTNGWAPGEVWDSLSVVQVRKLIEMTAFTYQMTYKGAARHLMERWEERAYAAKTQGLSTWRLWDRLGMMAFSEWGRA